MCDVKLNINHHPVDTRGLPAGRPFRGRLHSVLQRRAVFTSIS